MKIAKPIGAPGILGVTLVVGVLGMIGGFGAGFLSDLPGVGGLVGSGAFLVVVMAAALAVSVWWWRRLDEASREAHKWAWYWGGSAGMMLGLALVLTLATRNVDLGAFVAADTQPIDLIMGGMMSILVFQVVGYTLAWAWWWLARMRG
ncbi:MAG: hypothetical protein ACK4MI_06110 [Brevundimonas sp.]|uniref:hypothetical protein n=1 Tax=Brevundimonas sp. TaxID=1871086 RepID=UPI00391A23E2